MAASILTRDIFLKDPITNDIPNNGVADVTNLTTQAELDTLRYELKNFVCDGEYQRGLRLILNEYLKNLGKPEQSAVWVSGFYGSGKSHLVKVLQHLWVDHVFADGAHARGLPALTEDIREALQELTIASRREGGLFAAAGKLDANSDNIRLKVLRIVLQAAGLPESYSAAQLVLWLRSQGILDQVTQTVREAHKSFGDELASMYVSPILARAILNAQPNFARSEAEVRALIREQFPYKTDITETEMVSTISAAVSQNGKLPCMLIVLDELQQHIGDNSDRTFNIQLVTEACVKRFGSRLLFVATGQSALSDTPQLQKLRDRFRVYVQLSETDVETVTRKLILAKAQDKAPLVQNVLNTYSGEVSRHLRDTKIGPRVEDDKTKVADFPILPVRRRFWERVLRAADPTGTTGQLRNQLRISQEAVRDVAAKPLGAVIPGDFIYDQISNNMLQTGALLPEIDAIIRRQRDDTPEGTLRSRLCALILLIGKLPRDSGADIGIRATPEMLSDLLVDNLEEGSVELRKRVPELLEALVQKGDIMQVEDEYRLQTRESAAWSNELRSHYLKITNDADQVPSERASLLRTEVGAAVKDLKMLHGASKVPRKLDLYFGLDAPKPATITIPVWVRDGWETDEKTVRTDAQIAGTDSGMIFVFLPRQSSDELKKTIASALAAQETLDLRGVPSTLEGQEARKSIQTQLEQHERNRLRLVQEIISNGRVFQGGGSEATGLMLRDRVRAAAEGSLARMYQQFNMADDPRWERVLERVKKGDGNPLEVLGYTGDPEKQPICAAILSFLAGGKKGSEVRKRFGEPPYGWSQDAIDAALLILVANNFVRAAQNGTPLDRKTLDQTKIGVAEFRPESVTPGPRDLMAVRKLATELNVACKPTEELQAAPLICAAALKLAADASGDPPLPARPAVTFIEDVRQLSGNELIVGLARINPQLSPAIAEWKKTADGIRQRLPRWNTLNQLLDKAKDLPIATSVQSQTDAIRSNRALLTEPDPIQPLCDLLTDALREAVTRAHAAYAQAFNDGLRELTHSETWLKLDETQQNAILAGHELDQVPPIHVAGEDEVLSTLKAISLRDWRNRTDALRQRFDDAKLAAARLLEPKAVRLKLPGATLHTAEDVDAWLARVRERVIHEIEAGKAVVV
ncbi:MAG: BREX system P-loop protein BrxC [Chloroflexi bacterium]|nr:BREX system P-loop protein BrxC [Chloroflexota bacterium]